mmetsp:Transcript_3561/g.5270  ORF Transcript_3561/g.5270 Transcript_3561/m.5270 type:complete len:309 (+) Transcript_3561:165-1091(+)
MDSRKSYLPNILRLPQLTNILRKQTSTSNPKQTCCKIDLHGFTVYSQLYKGKWLRLSSPVYDFKNGVVDSRILLFLKAEAKRNKNNPGKLEWDGECEIVYSRKFPITILDDNRKEDFGGALKSFHETLISARQSLFDIRSDCSNSHMDHPTASRQGFFDDATKRRASCPSILTPTDYTKVSDLRPIVMPPCENENCSTAVVHEPFDTTRGGAKAQRRLSLAFLRKSPAEPVKTPTESFKDTCCEMRTRKTCESSSGSRFFDDELSDFIYPERSLPSTSKSNGGFCRRRETKDANRFVELDDFCSSNFP